ncbi:MAG: hypothetical protein JWR83_3097 [Aeromicrobium sp.]|nr:hypothetical protein [Aeromicrobium sp.]
MVDRAGRRLSTITIDQAISGGSNVLIAVLAARILGVESFGLFGIVFLVTITAQGGIRSLVCEPLLVRPKEAEERPGEAIGTALMLGAAMGVVVVLAAAGAWQWNRQLGEALLVIAVLLPLLSLQDLGRYLGFAIHRPMLALRLDTLWLILIVVAAVGLIVADIRSLAGFIAAWAGSGALAGLLVLWQHRGDRVRYGRAWLRESWMFSWRYLLSFAFNQGGALTATVALTAIAGARELAGVRGTLLLLSVAMTVQIGAGAAGVADISRLTSRTAVRSRAARISAITVVACLVNGAVLLALPASWGRLVLGDTWPAAEPLLVPVVIQVMLQGALLGARVGLLGTRSVRTTLVVDLCFTPVLVGSAIVGANLAGGKGYCWGVDIALAVVTCLWWVLLLRKLSMSEDSLEITPTTQGERQ